MERRFDTVKAHIVAGHKDCAAVQQRILLWSMTRMRQSSGPIGVLETKRSRIAFSREDMNREPQALCFLAGVNSIFYGPKRLTTPNPGRDCDRESMERLGLSAMEP
jgi:hypothetical protein